MQLPFDRLLLEQDKVVDPLQLVLKRVQIHKATILLQLDQMLDLVYKEIMPLQLVKELEKQVKQLMVLLLDEVLVVRARV